MEQQFTPLSTVNWGVSRPSSRMRKLKVLRASSANIGTTSMSSQSFAHSRLKMDEFNRYQVSNQNFKEKRLSEQESSLSNLRPMTGCQTDSSSKKISRKQQPYDRYQAYIEQNKAKYQTKSPDSKSINVKNRLLKSASARQMVPVRKSKSKMKLIKSGELMVMHQPREFEKIYGPELPKIQLSQQKIVKQKHDQIDKQKIKILAILSKELQSKFKRKSKKRLEEMHSLSDNESNFEQRIINQVYNRIEQTNQKREIAPQNINNNGNNLCIPGFYTNHIENLTINAGPAQLPMSLINNEVVSSITEDNKMMDVQDLNQDLQSTPNVLSQNSPQNENQLDQKSNSKAQKKTKILKFQRFVGSSSISHRNNTQNINSFSQTSQRKQEMESLDSEDAKILIKLKEDLKQMKRSASRSSQKGQTMKPEEKLQKLQSRMQKLREKSQELTEREVPVKKVSNTPRKSQVVEPFLNSLAPSNNKIPMKVPKNKLYKKFNTQNPKNIQLEMQIENENTPFFSTQNPKQEIQIPQTPESSFLRNKNQEISEISSQLKSKESIISDKPLKIMVGELCDTDHNHEKTVPQNEEPQKLASPVNKQPTQLSVEMEIPEEKDQEDEDGFLQFQFDARTDFLSSSDDKVPEIEQSKDALSVSQNLEIKRNSHIIVKDTHLEKFTKFLDCFKIETKILFNDEKKINMSQINKIKSEFEEPEKTKKDISLEHKNKNLLNQVSKKISNFMPNPNYQLELFATYKHLNEKKQLFDIYSEYPKNLAKKLERFLNAVVTYDRSSKCKHSLNQYKIQLFMPISSRPQFKKVIDIYNINCFKQKSANRESVKKHKEFIIIDEKEEQERKNKNQSIIDIIQDYSQRSTFKIITDPNEERAFRLTVHYDTKFYIRTGRKKQKECRLKQIVCQYTNIGDNDCQQSNCHDDEVIQQYSVYADLNWKNKINSAAVITLTNAVGLDNVVENISLFDIKTKTNLFGIYNQFDWKTIEYAKIKFEKCQKQEKFHNHQLKNINMILNPCRTVQNFFTYAVGEIEVDFKTKYKHQDNISMQYKLKVGLCLKNMISYINQQIFDLSYLSIIQYQTKLAPKKTQELTDISKMNDVESSTLHSIPRSFQQYSAYMFTSYNEQYLVNVIFNSTMCTLFRLHDPEMDYIFRVRTKNLQKILFKRLLAKQTDLAQKMISLKKHFCAKESIKYNQHKRSNSNELDKVLDYRIQHEMFTFHQDRINTYRDGDYNQSHFILEFRRQNALNQFGKEYCTYFIQHNLQDMVLEVKDSMNLFYNRIETHIDEDDQKHNILSHKFGFKSKLIIPHKNSNQIFEVYLPILVQKGKRKINKKQSKKEQNEKTFAIYGLMMDPGIVTDDSIKDITLDDIKSSDNESIRKNSNTPHQHHHHGFKKVPPVEGSALDHYKKLRVEREKQASKKNHHHRRPSNRSTPQSTISKAKKCNQHPTKDKFFLVEDQENIIQDFNFKYKKNYNIQTQNVVNQIMHQVEDDYIKQYQKQQEILDKIKVAKVKFLSRIRPENKSMQHFEFQQLNRRETEISYQRERLIKNLNVNYNFDVVRKNEMQQNPDRKQYRSQTLKMSQSKAGFKQYMDLKQAIVDAEGQYRQELKNSKSMSSRKVAFEVFKKRYNKIKNLGKDESDLELENELEIFQQSKLRRKEYQKQMEIKKIKLETLKKNKRKQFKSEKRSELEQSVQKLEPKYLKYDDIITKISLKILEIQQAHMERVDGCSRHDNLEKEEMKQKIKDLKLDYKKRHHKLEAGESSAGVIIDNQAKLSKQRAQYFISKMFNAVNCKNVKRMEEILRRFTQGTKENEHMFDSQGNSLVALAVINSDQEMVHLLLSRGMKANTQNLDGNTPLHYAVNSGQSKIVDILISHGADEKIVNHQGLTPWEINP